MKHMTEHKTREPELKHMTEHKTREPETASTLSCDSYSNVKIETEEIIGHLGGIVRFVIRIIIYLVYTPRIWDCKSQSQGTIEKYRNTGNTVNWN